MSTDQKLNILIALISLQVFMFLVAAVPRVIRELDTHRRTRRSKKLGDLDAKGEHERILRLADEYMEQWPNETYFEWAKARAFFKLKQYPEATALFQSLSEREPLWAEDAKKYLAAIQNAQQRT